VASTANAQFLSEVSGNQILAANEGEGKSRVWSPEERLHIASDPSEPTNWNGMTGCLKDDHQYVAFWSQRVVRWAKFPDHGKNTYYERNRRKNGTDQHDENQEQKEKGFTIGH
jgi:hypothetical protein